jgi:O-antigen/teichoic acid export membrane protein
MNNESELVRVGLRTRLADLKALAVKPYRHSVVRRTAVLLAFLLPAFAANFLLQYGAAKLLSVDQFGVFYVANTIGNVLYSGSVILNTFFTRYLVSVELAGGREAAYGAVLRIERVVVLVGLAIAAVLFVGFALMANKIGVQSRIIVLLIILDAYTAYVADLGRILLQSLRRTAQLGLYTLVWMVLRLVFCMIGIYFFGNVPAALIGVVASALVMLAGLHIFIARHRHDQIAALPKLPSATALIPMMATFGLLIAASNLDVLVSYFLLSETELGIYSASSILPKAILVVTMPLLQMLFPMVAAHDPSVHGLRVVLGKSGVVIFGLTAGAAFFAWATSGWLCGGTWGVKYCEAPTMNILLLSAVPLVLLRGLALLQFARGRDWLGLWLLLPTAVYLIIVSTSSWNKFVVAEQFTIFAGLSFVFLVVVQVGFEYFQSPRPPVRNAY